MLIDTSDYTPKLLEALGQLGAAAPATLAGSKALDAFGRQSG
ncbi:hypothetical protein [Paraburkholderia sejongensis]|nr:hypothetical protein [Paraburkholderia sp. MMS20-SJTR3]